MITYLTENLEKLTTRESEQRKTTWKRPSALPDPCTPRRRRVSVGFEHLHLVSQI
jgi:hypothetical protein